MCGIAGVANHDDAISIVIAMILRLNHRGTDSAGMTYGDELNMHRISGKGFVSEVLSEEKTASLSGSFAIAHTRYPTTGENSLENIQPLMIADSRLGPISIAHNGNLVNANPLREKLKNYGAAFESTTDTEVILHLILKSSKKDFIEILKEVFSTVKGAYSILIQTKDYIYAIRDPNAFRPLYICEINSSSYLFASETVAFDLIGDTSNIKKMREVLPGEIIRVGKDSPDFFQISEKEQKITSCSFEKVYLSRPDSFGIYDFRCKMGKELAKGETILADSIFAIPDSATTVAISFSEESRIRFHNGIIRDHSTSRTFILPNKKIREKVAGLKYNLIKELVEGKIIILVDDSLVRGTTIKNLITKLKNAGAKEVHVRIASPPIKYPCPYGVAMHTKKELIASKYDIEEIRVGIDADTLRYLSLDKFVQIVGKDKCIACFNGEYPVYPEDQMKEAAFSC